jgi:hypothetical protein
VAGGWDAVYRAVAARDAGSALDAIHHNGRVHETDLVGEQTSSENAA